MLLILNDQKLHKVCKITSNRLQFKRTFFFSDNNKNLTVLNTCSLRTLYQLYGTKGSNPLLVAKIVKNDLLVLSPHHLVTMTDQEGEKNN